MLREMLTLRASLYFTSPRDRQTMLRASDGEPPARCGRALGSSLKVLCCGWTGCRDSQNSSGWPECSFAKTSSDLPPASPSRSAWSAFVHTVASPATQSCRVGKSLSHLCATPCADALDWSVPSSSSPRASVPGLPPTC